MLSGRPNPYQAKVERGGNQVQLGTFATAEEAALCVARSPEGQAAAKRAAAAPPPKAPLTREQALQQAQAEGLVLRKADSQSGYAGVGILSGRSNPYKAEVKRSGKQVHLGSFATAEEAALCVAQSPEGQAAAAARAAALPPTVPLTREQALQQAQADGITLRKADNKSGYASVAVLSGRPTRPYKARVRGSGTMVHLGNFATAEEAALSVARSPEGQAAAERAAPAPPTAGSKQGKSKAPVKPTVKEEGSVPPMPLDAVVKDEGTVPPMPSEARWSDTIVKEEHEVADNGEQPRKKRKNQ